MQAFDVISFLSRSMSLPPNLKELLGCTRQLIVAEAAAALSTGESLEQPPCENPRRPNFV
jgi:hypothetical protein